MRFRSSLLAVSLSLVNSLWSSAVEPAKPAAPGASALSPEEERAAFTVPPGYTVELVAAESEGIGKFVPLAFDAQGRLWTTTAFEYPVDGNENPAAADALYASRAKDKVLVFDTPFAPGPQTPRVFAEGLAIPLGVLPYGDGCYVQHGHDIVLLHDTEGDGKADKREVILTGFGVQDSHLFPHQFMRAPGGWLWMAQGAFNYSKVLRPGEPKEKAVQFDQTRMAKFRPDGSEFTITSNGPCNIWGLVLNGEGEAFIQEANDFGYPVMPFHEFGNYPGCSNSQWKSYAPEFPGTPGIPMGGTGLSGLALTDAAGPFTDAWRDVMLVANPITNKINAIKMHRDGARWKLEKLPDFMASADPWFRPVAITIGPDGCLYIVDWYNKIISHNEVPRNHPDRDKTRGRIWRVKATATKPFDVPDFTKISGEELVAKLGGPSLAQSHLAWQAIGDRGLKELAPQLQSLVFDAARSPANTAPGASGGASSPAASARIAALWALRALNLANANDLVEHLYAKGAEQNRNLRREAVAALDEPLSHRSITMEALQDSDAEVRATMIRRLEDEVLKSSDLSIGTLLTAALDPISAPTAPSTQNGKPIKVLEAYDREFQRYLVRLLLEKHPAEVAQFLDKKEALELPVENRVLAALSLAPKTSASRVAQLLPQLQRPPGPEEILRLAQFPDEPGVGEALQTLLQSPVSGTSVLETMLSVRTKLDAAKLAPILNVAAGQLLCSNAVQRQALGVRLVSGFQLAAQEEPLVQLLQTTEAETNAALIASVIRALGTLGTQRSELLAKLAVNKYDDEIRREALIALTSSKAADAPGLVLSFLPKLSTSERRSALERLSASKRGASALVAALTSGAISRNDVDTNLLDRLLAVLGAEDPGLTALVESLGTLFRPVLSLDGTEEAWVQTNVTLEGPCTIEAWVRLDPQGRAIGNADGLGGAPGQLDLNFYGGKFRVFAYEAGDVAVAKKPLTPGLWTHVAATRDAAGLWKLYIDGEFDSAGAKPAQGKIENFRVAWTGSPAGPRGALSDFRIWDRERTADEIRATSDRSLAPGAVAPGLIYAPAAQDGWGTLQKGAKVAKTSDFPPILTGDEAVALDAQYVKYRALAEKPGDPVKGHAVSMLCQACHLMGPTGGNIGPNLSGVGAMGTEAILRNILQPNAAMENGYRIYRVELKNGNLIDALFVSEDNDAVIIRMPGSEDRRIAKSEVRSAKYLRRSLMPEGLLETMPPESASDLFAYLKTLR